MQYTDQPVRKTGVTKLFSRKYISLLAVFVIIFSCFAVIPVQGAEVAANDLTIQGALDKACKNNPDLRTASLNIEKAGIVKDDLAWKVEGTYTAGMVSTANQTLMSGYQNADLAWTKAKKGEKATTDALSYNVITAYSTVVQKNNSMELARLQAENARQQLKVKSLAKSVGLLADFDYDKSVLACKKLEDAYKASQTEYTAAAATLRTLLGESETWQPSLSSKALINSFVRDTLAIELSRGLSQSYALWAAQADLDNQDLQSHYYVSGDSFKTTKVNLELAEANVEKTRRDTQSQIEQLYLALDTLENQISLADKAYTTSAKDLELAKLKYSLGMIPQASMTGTDDLASYNLAAENARIALENARFTLVQKKAQFAYLTSRTPFDAKDWSPVPATAQTTKK